MSAQLATRAAGATDVGRARDQNEDAYFVGMHVFAVADGLGGHLAGEVASNLALESVSALDGQSPSKAADQLANAIRRANKTVHDRAQRDQALKGMGTTMTALTVDGAQASLGHVGDSRCYLIRGGRISQISTDHTLVARMVDEGKLTQEQAETHPQRSILTRALGADREVEIEEVTFDIAPGDLLILCSDGLTSVLDDEDILQFASGTGDPAAIASALVNEANERGGPDNITVVAVACVGDGAPIRDHPGAPGAPPKQRRKLPARAVIWALVVLLVLGGGALAVRVWVNQSWYVGLHGEQVAIYHGVPVNVAGLHLNSVAEDTGVRADRLPPQLRANVEQGISAPTLVAARQIVRERIEPNARPVPTPKPTPKASPSPKATK